MSNEIKTERNKILDIAKGVGILSVVYCHSIEIYNNAFTFRFFYLFHMAFFFILSGYFFKDKYALNYNSIKEFIQKRAKSLLIPYLGFNIVFLLLHNFFLDISFLPEKESFFTNILDTKVMLTHVIERYTNLDIFKHFIWILLLGKEEFFVGTTWFLKVLFFISSSYLIGVYFVNKIKNEKMKELVKFAICFLCLAFGYYLSIIGFGFYKIGTMLSCAILYYIGTVHKKYENYIPKINIYWAFALTTVCLIFINIHNPKYFFISRNWYNNPFWFLTASVFGYIWMVLLSNILSKNNFVEKILSYIGRHTISILCLHLVFFKITILIQILIWHKPIEMLQAYETYYTSYCWGFIYTSISVIFCLFVLKLYNYLIQLKKKILFNKHN